MNNLVDIYQMDSQDYCSTTFKSSWCEPKIKDSQSDITERYKFYNLLRHIGYHNSLSNDRLYPLRIQNSLTRSKVRFIPKDPSRVLWYQCGPTVYADSHMGHARTYVGLDVLRRIMEDFFGFNIILCQNITDVDDKIIIKSSEQKIDFRSLASKYEEEFFEDMAKLGVQMPDIVTRVSEFIPQIINYINDLICKGIAYESNGSVYFNTKAFEVAGHVYGKLMPEQIGNSDLLAEGEGALTSNDDKKNPTDFVLWKKTKLHTEGVVEPAWESPWGNGRPGLAFFFFFFDFNHFNNFEFEF